MLFKNKINYHDNGKIVSYVYLIIDKQELLIICSIQLVVKFGVLYFKINCKVLACVTFPYERRVLVARKLGRQHKIDREKKLFRSYGNVCCAG